MVFLCKKCNQTFTNIFDYKKHIVGHSSEQSSNTLSSSASKTTSTPNTSTNINFASSSFQPRNPTKSSTSPILHSQHHHQAGVDRTSSSPISSTSIHSSTTRTSPSHAESYHSESTKSVLSGGSGNISSFGRPSSASPPSQHSFPHDNRMYSNDPPFYQQFHPPVFQNVQLPYPGAYLPSYPSVPLYHQHYKQNNPPIPSYHHHAHHFQNQEIEQLSDNFANSANLGSYSKPQASISEPMRSIWYCPICNVECNSQQKLNEHKQGKTHLKKLKNHHLLSEQVSPQNVNNERPPSSASTSPLPSLSDLKDVIELQKRETGDWFKCKICDVECNGPDVLMNHLGGKQHKKNRERYELKTKLLETENTKNNVGTQQSGVRSSDDGISSNTDTSLESITEMINSGKLIKRDGGSEEGFYCAICETFCNSLDALKDHISGKKHLKNMKNAAALELREKSMKLQTPASLHTHQQQDEEFYRVIGINTNDQYLDFDLSRGVQILEYFFTKVYFQKPSYIEESEGPPHSMTFKCLIHVEHHNFTVEGIASSKKDAKRYAAIETCRVLNEKGLLKEVVPDYLYYNPLSSLSNK
nr:unnamed protein product [Naegleria fowleri]